MLETLHKLALVGLGVLDLSEEKLRDVFKDLVKRGELTEKEATEMATRLLKQADEHRVKLTALIEERVHELLKHHGVPKKEDVAELHERVSALEEKAKGWESADTEC